MKILYICPWPLTPETYKAGEYPKTEFGYYTMAQRDDIMIDSYAPNRDSMIVKWMWKRLPGVVGPLLTQLGCIRKAGKYDVVYVAFDMHLMPLALFKALHLIRTPVFVLSHFTYNWHYKRGKVRQLFMRVERWMVTHFIDRISFASEALLEMFNNISRGGKYSANWGADLNFYQKEDNERGNFFLAAGGMNRDYATLIDAFRKIPDANLRIYAKYKDYARGKTIPENVMFGNLFDGNDFCGAYKALRKEYANCIAVVLPIDYINDVPNGATVLTEALAMGKPIIITEADTNYIDVEKEGCGMTVKPHDADDLARVIRWFMSNPEEVKRMGDRSYELTRTKYNDENFVNTIYAQMKELVESKQRKR